MTQPSFLFGLIAQYLRQPVILESDVSFMLVVKQMAVVSRRTVPRFSQHAVSVLAEIWIYLLLMLPVMPCMLSCDRRLERSLFVLPPHPPLHNLGVKTFFGNRRRAGGNTAPLCCNPVGMAP